MHPNHHFRSALPALGARPRQLRLEPLEERRLLVADVETGLVGFWKLDETAAGQVVVDASGLGNNGQHVNLVAPEQPVVDVAIDESTASRALALLGRGGFVDIPAGPSLDFAGGFTQSVWVKAQADDTGFHGILGYAAGGVATRGPSIWVYQQTRIHAGFGDGTNWNSVLTDSVLSPNEWTHVATTFDGTNYRVYVDGAQILVSAAYAGRTAVDIPKFYIGRADNFFEGILDHVRLYTRSLTAEDIQALFQEGAEVVEPPAAGLVGHWKLDETAIGSSVVDASGSGNNGVHVNLVLPQGPSTDIAVNEGTSSRSLSLDGQNDYVSIVGNSALNLSGGKFTQSLWIKPTADNAGYNGVLGLQNGVAGRAPSIWVLDNNRLHAGFGDGTRFHSLVTPSVLQVGQWNHVATTYDGTTYRLYVRGTEVATIGGFTGQAPLPLTALNIGRVDNNFQGGIDDVRVYNVALTPSQVADLAQVVIPPPDEIPPGLVGHWRLDEQTLGALAAEETGLSQAGSPRNFAAPHGPSSDVALADGALAPRSLSFDGVNDFVQIANSPALDFSGGQFTQSLWIRPNLSDTGFHGVLGFHPSLNQRAPSIWVFDRTRIHAGFGDGTSWNSLVTGSILEADAWNHLVVTFDGTAYRVYHNGQLAHTDASAAGKIPFPSSRLDIGRVDNYFPGLIDDVRVYNRAISTAEVEDLFEDVQADTGTISLAQNDYLLDESAGMAQVTIVRTAGSTTAATVDYTTISGSATPGQDYTQRSGQINFQPGQTSATVVVFLLNDSTVEGTETFGFAIDRVTGANLGVVRTANVKIFDNDLPPGSGQPPGTPIVVFTDATYEHLEDGGNATLRVFRAGSTANAVGVGFATGSGTATPNADFTPRTGTITIPAGAREGTITVPVLNDALAESNETAQVLLTGVGGGVLGLDSVAELVILDDDTGAFARETVVSGLGTPTTFDFLPDGRVLIGDQNGLVRIAQNGSLLPTPFVDLRSRVNHVQDRGLIGLTVHPNFPTTPYVYLLYVYDPPETQGKPGLAGPDQGGNRVSRLTRVEADPATNYATAKPGSEVVILGKNSVWANISNPDKDGTQDVTLPPSCGTGSRLNDCLPVDALSHAVGTVAFGPDGALYVSTGDASSFGRVDPRAARSLDIDTLVGKVLRIDPATGAGLSDNPFFNPLAPASNRSRVYSYGFRNAFRFALHPDSGEPFVGDVGWNNWEEINTGRGLNFGWPYYEGGSGGVPLRTNGYQDLPEAQAFYASGTPVEPPLHARSHGEGAVSITMGDFYKGTTFPPLYHDALFYADLLGGVVEAIIFDAAGEVGSVQRFADDVPGIVQMQTGSDGNLYFLNIFNGKLERFVPVTGGTSTVNPGNPGDDDDVTQSQLASALQTLDAARALATFDRVRAAAAPDVRARAAARDIALEELAEKPRRLQSPIASYTSSRDGSTAAGRAWHDVRKGIQLSLATDLESESLPRMIGSVLEVI